MGFCGMRRILSYTRKCVDTYNMIEEGDVIAVGLSGGKDSLTLLCALHDLAIFYPKHFQIKAICIDLGFEGSDFSEIEAFCEKLNIELIIKHTQISTVVFDIRKEDSPCSLCANMRRGALNDAAKENGCNKVALGHHFDDLIETFMLNLIHEGRLGVYPPVTYLTRADLTVIRPLSFLQEKDARYFANHNELPVFVNPCPEDKMTQRESVKHLVAGLEKENKGFKHRVFKAIQKANLDGWNIKEEENELQ